MRGIVIHPIILDIATWIIIVLLLVGLSMMGYGIIQWARQSQKQKQTMERQNNDIKELEHSLEILRQEYNSQYLVELPNILTSINQHLQKTVEQVAKPVHSDTLIFEVLQSWAAKVGVKIWYKPKNNKINKLLWHLQILSLLSQFKKVLNLLDNKMIMTLHKLAGELNDKDIGLSSILGKPYEKMKSKLDDILKGLGSPNTNKHIQNYLLSSYSLNSLLLLVKYTASPEYMKWLPIKYRTPETSIIQAINIYMSNLRAEVVKHIQLYLIGRE